METCKAIILQTVNGLTTLFIEMGGSPQLVDSIIKNDEFYDTIVNWLKSTNLFNKNLAIQEFIQLIPQLVHYSHLIENSLQIHEKLWNQVFINLLECQSLLK